MSILESIKLDSYRIGQCQAIIYDRKRPEIFPAGFLSRLYFSFLGSRYSKRSGTGILETMMCGCPDLSHDATTLYWMTHALSILGVWKEDVFEPCGVVFPTQMIGAGEEERACYAGYGFFAHWWGSAELEVLSMIGISQLFVEMNLRALHGCRYTDNDATAQFMARFGFRDVATLPAQMTRGGKLVPATISTLPRADFEAYVERQILDTYRASKQV